jgi:hypothetical protein
MPVKISNALTPMKVKSADPGRYADGGGLYLLVKEPSVDAVKRAKAGKPAQGARSWVFRFMLKGKSRDVGLGSAGPDGISLAAARDLALAFRLKVKNGIDPLEERHREASQALAEAQAARGCRNHVQGRGRGLYRRA